MDHWEEAQPDFSDNSHVDTCQLDCCVGAAPITQSGTSQHNLQLLSKHHAAMSSEEFAVKYDTLQFSAGSSPDHKFVYGGKAMQSQYLTR